MYACLTQAALSIPDARGCCFDHNVDLMRCAPYAQHGAVVDRYGGPLALFPLVFLLFLFLDLI